ncbi:hypothetical protein IJ818_07635 [bacterium]|nr:hypothetical protein [bacterium]
MLQNSSKAFSLAEAVITLIFLSIIAAQLIPAVNATRPSTEKLLFKKAYSTVENTISSILNDDNLYPVTYMTKTCNGITQDCQSGFLVTDTGSTDDPNKKGTYYAYKALIDSSKCKDNSNAGTNIDKLVRLFCASLNTTRANCSAHSCSFTTTDGMQWTVTQNSNSAQYTPSCCHSLSGVNPMLSIMVDVNGDAEPNTNTGVNIPDQYYMNVYYNGKVEVNKTLSEKGITFLKNPTNNKRRSDLEDDRYGKD